MDWIVQYGQVVAFLAQLLYWAGMVLFLGYAVWQYKRWVNFQMGVGKSGKLNTDKNVDADIKVEEFVE
ncbi:MAG: hypothetical protein CVT67_11015 [Actinobacteria bacterium HGW-Actinobacteria-7]|nr:MAG: hypothetical protein CVT67_11015 [Actinobacteria bacterium HGW-Actinobacteria-7]